MNRQGGLMQFPATQSEVTQALGPYYRAERPLDFFFEMFVCSVLDQMPAPTVAALKSFEAKHSGIFGGRPWERFVRETLHLSETIDVAIWDLWLRNLHAYRDSDGRYQVREYARDFLENYVQDGSRVDVWTPETLADAKTRIRTFRDG